MSKNQQQPMAPQDVVQRRDEAVRRALNTPPKPLKEMKKGKEKKRQDRPTTSSEKRT